MGHPKVRVSDITPNEVSTATDAELTVSSSVVQLSSVMTPDQRTTHILFDVQDQPVRFTLDDSNPAASNGHRLVAGDTGVWPVRMALKAKWIREGGTDAAIHFSQMTE